MRHFTHFFIAGFTYYDGALVFNKLKIGTNLRMQREPGNRFDAKAVAIYYKDAHLGYVPRTDNDAICKILEMGHDIFGMVVLQINPSANPENQIGVKVFVKKNKLL